MLRDRGAITDEQLAHALEQQEVTGALLGEALLELGLRVRGDPRPHPGRAVRTALHRSRGGLPPRPGRGAAHPGVHRPPLLRHPHQGKRDPALTLVMSNPLDIEAVDTVRALTHLDVHKAVSTEQSIVAVIDRCYREDALIEKDLRDIIELEASGRDEQRATWPWTRTSFACTPTMRRWCGS